MANVRSLLNHFVADESGQGIVEYGAVLAFVAVLVALVFSMGNSVLKNAISAAFSSVAMQLQNLSSAAASAS